MTGGPLLSLQVAEGRAPLWSTGPTHLDCGLSDHAHLYSLGYHRWLCLLKTLLFLSRGSPFLFLSRVLHLDFDSAVG